MLRNALRSVRQHVAERTSMLSELVWGYEVGPVSSSVETITAVQLQQCRWASKKQGGSTQNNKDSNPKFLGVKLYGGQYCIPGNIIVRQRGTQFHPGLNVGMGKDHTIFSLIDGRVQFSKDKRRKRTFIHVQPHLQHKADAAVATQ